MSLDIFVIIGDKLSHGISWELLNTNIFAPFRWLGLLIETRTIAKGITVELDLFYDINTFRIINMSKISPGGCLAMLMNGTTDCSLQNYFLVYSYVIILFISQIAPNYIS